MSRAPWRMWRPLWKKAAQRRKKCRPRRSRSRPRCRLLPEQPGSRAPLWKIWSLRPRNCRRFRRRCRAWWPDSRSAMPMRRRRLCACADNPAPAKSGLRKASMTTTLLEKPGAEQANLEHADGDAERQIVALHLGDGDLRPGHRLHPFRSDAPADYRPAECPRPCQRA